MSERRVDPPGTTPWDRWAGARVGGLAGGVLTAVIVVAVGPGWFWLVLVGAAAGAFAGYRIERRRSL